ncbi:MAG: hypothetical protein AB7U83_03810 [Vicinamibacterales bacterium]
MLNNALWKHALVAALAAGPLVVAADATLDSVTNPTAEAPASDDARRVVREVTIPAGTQLRLQLETSHASNTSRAEDAVQARLAAPVVVDGRTVLPTNTPATGHVTVARPSGKVKGRAYLAVRFTEVRPGDTRYAMTTRTWGREAQGTRKKDAAKIAVPGAVGAVVGAAIDGKKGAAVGAGVGAGAGTAVVLSTAGDEVRLPRGATVLVRLSAPLTVRVAS